MKKILLLAFLAVLLSACGERIKTDDAIDSDPAGANGQQNSAEAGGATAGTIDGAGIDGGTALAGGKLVSYEKNAIYDDNNVLSGRLIYFPFDSNEVPDEYLELVKHHGKYLSLNPQAKVRLEGHADERGTREYNVALAERRAQAVQQLMLYEGADASQITVVSYGEEKPAAFGHDDESMQLNRRVEIIYP